LKAQITANFNSALFPDIGFSSASYLFVHYLWAFNTDQFMNWREFGRKMLPHIIVIGIFAILSMFFLTPVWQKHKALPQNDVKQWKGSYEEIRTYQEETGNRTLWTNSMFGGMPTYQIAPYSPNSLVGLKYVYGWLVSGETLFPVPVNAIFLYMFGAYLMLLAFRVNPWLAMAGAIAYGFSSFNIVILEAGHMLQAYALGTAPMVIAALVYTLRWRRYLWGAALFGVALAFHLRTNHPQMTYYTAFVIGFYLIGELIWHIRKGQFAPLLKSAGMLLIATLLAVGANITYLWTTQEYGKETTRGKSELTQAKPSEANGLDQGYAFDWSYGIGETFTFLIPNFRGGPSAAAGDRYKDALKAADPQVREVVGQMDAYWGDQPFTSGPVYLGAVMFFLFVLGLFFLKGTDRWWTLAVFVLSIFLAWGHNFLSFNTFMFDHFPLYNKFRSPTFTLVMASMVVPLLGALYLDRIIRHAQWDKEGKKKFYWALGLTGGLCLLFVIMPSLAGDFLKPVADGATESPDYAILKQNNFPAESANAVVSGLQDVRESILRSDAIRSLFFILLAAALLYSFFRSWIKKEIVFVGMALLITIDLVSVDNRYLNEKNFVAPVNNDILPTQADIFVQKDRDPDYRVINIAVNTFNDATTSYFHRSIGGYHGAKLRRFQEMREKYLDQTVGLLKENLSKLPPAQLLEYLQMHNQLSILNMMNVRYIIAGPDSTTVIRNPYALGSAWFVKAVQWEETGDAEMAALANFNPRDTALVNVKYKSYLADLGNDSSGSITLTSYKPDEMTYSSTATANRLAVFPEVYYNDNLGWHAYIDGQKVEHIKVNWLLRGLKVPAGKHTIVFKFEPSSFYTGEKIAMASSIGLILLVLGGIAWSFYRKPTQEGVVETDVE
jgi:hypothetical protein